jgi:hypothetical protein
LIEKNKFENKFIKVMLTNRYRHELFLPLPQGFLDFENFFAQTEALTLNEYEEAYLQLQGDSNLEFFLEDEEEVFLYDDDSSFYTIFKDFYEPFNSYKLKNSQLENFLNFKRPEVTELEPTVLSDFFGLFIELDLPFYNLDKRFKILCSLKDKYSFAKFDELEEKKYEYT